MKPSRDSLFAAVVAALISTTGFTASHREAPMIAFDPAADNTDVYAFVGYDVDNVGRSSDERRVTFILNVNPGQEPGDGPNYFSFADDVLYQIHIDNDQDGAENIIYQFRFETETRPIGGSLTGPLPFIGNPNIPVAALQGITSLDGPGSEGLILRQTYSVVEVRERTERRRSRAAVGRRGDNVRRRTDLFHGQTLVAVPSNAGSATMPDYEDLAAQGIYADGSYRVFAGQRAETFYIDLGAVFDTVNLRRPVPALTVAEDADDTVDPFGINRFSGANVSTIAIEVPITQITSDGRSADATAFPVIGVYASTSRQRVRTFFSERQRRRHGKLVENRGRYVQVSRMANPLVNELIIDTPTKDRWNASEPEDEAQFQRFFKNPTVAAQLELIFGIPVATTPRTDLMQLLLKYPGQPLARRGRCGDPCAELLRLDLRVPPMPAEEQKRLTVFAHDAAGAPTPDPAGFPNGRRPNDDVTDIVIRVVGGENYVANRVGDGVNNLADAPGAGTGDGPGYGTVSGNRLDVTENGIAREFPFLPTPHDGRDRRHIDCGEAGANPCN